MAVKTKKAKAGSDVEKVAAVVTQQYEESEWQEIAPFDNTKAGTDANYALVIMCHMIQNADKYGVAKVEAKQPDGTPLLIDGKKVNVHALRKKHIYSVIQQQTSVDISTYKKDNVLDQGIYRISMKATAMNDEANGKNSYAKGGIYFARTSSVGWDYGFILGRPGYERSGFYKKMVVEPTELKTACEWFVKRLTTKETSKEEEKLPV